MYSNEGRCRWCGRDVYWITVNGRRTPIEQSYTAYKLVKHPGSVLYTQLGRPIPCEILPKVREREAEGWAHIYHLCPKKPGYHRPRPLTRKEKFREAFE